MNNPKINSHHLAWPNDTSSGQPKQLIKHFNKITKIKTTE